MGQGAPSGCSEKRLGARPCQYFLGQVLVPVQPIGTSPHVPSSGAGIPAQENSHKGEASRAAEGQGCQPWGKDEGQAVSPGGGMGSPAGSPCRWLFDQAVCTLSAFCGVLFGLCSLASLTVLSTVCCPKVCYPAYSRCWMCYPILTHTPLC